MKKIDLAKHKELFKILPEEEYAELEKALEQGLFLTSQAVEGQGERLLGNKKLEMSLPVLYDYFKRISNLRGKQKGITLSERSFRDCLNIDDFSDNKMDAIVLGWYLSIIIPGAILAIAYRGTNPVLFLTGIGIIAGGFVDAVVGVETQKKYDRMYSTAGLVTGAARKTSDIIKKKRSDYLSKRVQKQEARIKTGLIKVVYGEQSYTEEWVRKQEKELLKILENEEAQEFANAYTEVERRLVPLHKLELHKNIEQHLYKEIEKGNDTKKTAEKLRKAKKAGVILNSLEEELKQKINKKRAEITKKCRELRKEDNELKNMLEKIED